MKPSLLALCLLLASCGSSSEPHAIKVYAVNLDYSFAEQVTTGIQAKFDAAGIPVVFSMAGISWPNSYAFGQKQQALTELSNVYGAGHYLVPKFGNYFDGMASGNSSISVAVKGRLQDSIEQAAHEIAHSLGARHDYANCNIMSYRHCGYPAEFNEKAIEEMR